MVQLLIYMVIALFSGMLTFLAPCTLPVLPAYFAYAGTSGEGVFKNTLFFALGLVLVFVTLGLAAGSLGSIVSQFRRELTVITGVVLIVFGIMSLLGINLQLFSSNKQFKRNPFGSFLFGATFGLTWSSCIGPVLGLILVLAANTATALSGAILLFMYAIGLVTPLILIAIFLNKLDRKGRVWKLFKGKLLEIHIGQKTFFIHSTNLISGTMFIFVGSIMLTNIPFTFGSGFMIFINDKLFAIQDWFVTAFTLYL